MNKNKGFVYTIDCLIALMMVSVLILFVFDYNEETDIDYEEIILSNKIKDLLITTKYLEIKDVEQLSNNFKKLIPNRSGYVKINNNYKYIKSKNNNNKEIISNSITYINSSNKKLYVEIGIYY
jgi:hypothetical protein